MIRSHKATLLAGLAVVATALGGGAGSVLAQSPAAAAPTGYAELDAAMGADKPFNGKKVSIQTQWIGGEGANFADSVAAFEAATGIDIQIDSIGSSHETVLRTRIDGGAPPDLAVLAQPSGVVQYGQQGKLVDIASIMDTKKLAAEHPATIGLVTDGDHIWGIPYKVDVKSVVWYPIKAFKAAGYEVPTTWDELLALSDKIVADGKGNPWCIGMEAGTATGWQATDWLEDVVLRTAGIDVYNKWITHEVKFDSPEIKAAMDDVAKIFFTPNYVLGGNTGIVAIHQTDPMDPMFPPDGNWDGFTPGCWMQKQATWYGPDFFPDVKAGGPGTVSQYKLGEDIGLFYFPTIDPAQGTPALGSGDTLMVLKDRPEVRAVAEYMSTPDALKTWIQAGSAISANQATPADWYAGNYKLQVASDIVAKATSFGFDASDLMPASVGAGTEWTGLVDWINANGANTEDVLKAIDASWPTN
jgi:alpha-glucoside transport system substrate-binding protein